MELLIRDRSTQPIARPDFRYNRTTPVGRGMKDDNNPLRRQITVSIDHKRVEQPNQLRSVSSYFTAGTVIDSSQYLISKPSGWYRSLQYEPTASKLETWQYLGHCNLDSA